MSSSAGKIACTLAGGFRQQKAPVWGRWVVGVRDRGLDKRDSGTYQLDCVVSTGCEQNVVEVVVIVDARVLLWLSNGEETVAISDRAVEVPLLSWVHFQAVAIGMQPRFSGKPVCSLLYAGRIGEVVKDCN